MTRSSRYQRSGLKRQQGVAALFLAISLVAIMTAVGFALELGQIYASKVELRKQAEIVALDTVMAAGGCANPETAEGRIALANQAAADSLRRLGKKDFDLDRVQLGLEYMQGNMRRFAATPSAMNAHAAAVTLSRPLPEPIMPLLPRREGAKLEETAAASRSHYATFTTTPYTLNAAPLGGDPLADLLEAILGRDPGLGNAAITALVGSSVEIQDLADSAGVPSIPDLLTQPVTASGLLSILANALLNAGEGAAAAAVNLVAASAPATAEMPFAERAGLPSDIPAEATQLRVESFDLVRSALFSAAPVFQITPDVEIPGVGSVIGDVVVLDLPSSQAGSLARDEEGNLSRTAESSQISLDLSVELLPDLADVAGVRLDLDIDVGKVSATLADLHCASVDDPRILVELMATPALASLGVSASVSILGIDLELQLNDVDGPIQLGCDVPAYNSFEPPFPSDAWNVASTACPSGSNALVGGLLSSLVSGGVQINLEGVPLVSRVALEAIVPVVEPLISGALTPVLNQLERDLLYPLLSVLGVSLGGGEVKVTSFQASQPSLILPR